MSNNQSAWIVEVRDSTFRPWELSGFVYNNREQARRAKPVALSVFKYAKVVRYSRQTWVKA